MQVQSISNQSFDGRRDRVDSMIKLDDREIQQKAYERALSQHDHSKDIKNNRKTNALFYSAPIVAGLGSMLLAESGETRLFSKNLSGAAGRMAKGLKTAAFLTVVLGAIDLLGLTKRKAAQNSQEVRNFDRKHPTMSFMATLGAGIALITALPLGIAKAGKLFKPEFTNGIANKVGKYAEKINNSNVVDVVKNAMVKASEKTPNWIKTVGAVALDWSPAALVFGGMFNSLRSSNERTAQFVDNYNENYSHMKEKQVNLSRARLREISQAAMVKDEMIQQLAIQKAAAEFDNDLLMQDVHNQKEIDIIADGSRAGMPQEVVEKVNSLHDEHIAETQIIDEQIDIPQDENVEE